MKTLLVPVTLHDALPSVFDTAVLVARRFGSLIEGVALRPALAEYVPVDMVGGMTWLRDEEADKAEAEAAGGRFVAFMQQAGVPLAEDGPCTPASVAAAGPRYRWRPDVPAGDAFLGQFGDFRPARVIQAHHLRGFVESFAGRIVERLAEQAVLANAIDLNQLRMPTGDQQSDERKFRRFRLQHRCQQVAFHVVHTKRRYAPGKRQRLCAGSTDQQRADQARTRSVGDCIDLGRHAVGLGQHLTDQGQHALDVVTRGQLRDHTAIDAVQVDLTEQCVRQQTTLTVIQCDAGFVAGGF